MGQLGFPLILPPLVSVRVVASTWPMSFPLQLLLSWPVVTRYPCVQQYPFGLRLAIHTALSNGGRRPPYLAAEGDMVARPVVVLEVGTALSFATSAAFVARTVCKCSLKLLLVVVSS